MMESGSAFSSDSSSLWHAPSLLQPFHTSSGISRLVSGPTPPRLLNLRLTYFTAPAWNDVSTKWTCQCFLNVGPSCRVCLHGPIEGGRGLGGANCDVTK